MNLWPFVSQGDINALWKAYAHLTARQEKIMATVQDLVTSLNTLRESVKKLAAEKIESQQQLQEARNIIEETTKIADDAAADDASQGGSTGGGSGAAG